MPKYNSIIAFEGLDCSFKETNYKSFLYKLRDMRGPYFKIHKESFPRYNNSSAIGIKKWLNGDFDRDVLMNLPEARKMLYSLDRFSYWYDSADTTDGTRRIELLNDTNNFHYFVFDRYSLSNTIYNPNDKNDLSIDDFLFDKDKFAIPNPNVIVWMRMKNFDVLKNLILKKNNKDENETDLEYLEEVWNRSEKMISNDFRSLSIKLLVVECLDKDNNIRSREELNAEIWERICWSII